MDREYEHEDIIDLGEVKVETKGTVGVPEDSEAGLIPLTGLNVE